MPSVVQSVATAKLNSAAEDLLEPLLSDDDDDSEGEGEGENEDIEKQGPLEKLKTVAVYGVLAAGVASFAAAFVFAPVPLVFVAGGICMANAPYSAYKEYHLSKIPTLRSLVNNLRDDANRLGEQVDVLSAEIDVLEPEADRAAEVEEQLRGIADKQQYNVDKLVDFVKENGEIIEAMKINLRKRVVQDIIKIVVDSDKDNDMSINKKESMMLALKIRIQLQEYGVEFNEDKFVEVVSRNPTVPAIINLVKKLTPDDSAEAEEAAAEDEDMDALDEMFVWNEDKTGVSGEEGKKESLLSSTRGIKQQRSVRMRATVVKQDSTSVEVTL